MKKLVSNLVIIVGLVMVTACSSDDSDLPVQKMELTINDKAFVFNAILVDRLGANEERVYTATINNSTNNIISFLAGVGEEGTGIVRSFTYRTNGKLYTVAQSSDNFIDFVTTNTNARFTMSFSGILSTFNTETESYESIAVTDGDLDVEY